MERQYTDTVSAIESPELNLSRRAREIMTEGDILAEDETPYQMLERIVSILPPVETDAFDVPEEDAAEFASEMLELFLDRKVVPSTPIMTNAGRFDDRPLSACSVPPVDLNGSYEAIKRVTDTYHEAGMGTGFSLDRADDPLPTLLDLQEIARSGLEREEQHRPVGNMGIMKVDNPDIRDFARIKQAHPDIDWKFNLSVNMTAEFMDAYHAGEPFELDDGTVIDPRDLMDDIVDAAWDTADPGLVFLDNMNERRPFTEELNYVSVAPCGEVGLAEGETCQFSSINIAAFVDGDGIDWNELRRVTRRVTRFLDDVLEYSIRQYSHEESVETMRKSRKIGIGYCGYSKLLTRLGLPYNSPAANRLLRDTLSFINYHSKRYAMELARDDRGSFDGWNESTYADSDTMFLSEKFGDEDSRMVSRSDWESLDAEIQEHGLRNSTTVILPPTGRSAMTFDTSQQIEPIFSLSDRYDRLNPEFRQVVERLDGVDTESVLQQVRDTGSCQNIDVLPDRVKEVFRTAIEIGYREHFNVLVEAQTFVDEAVSKTINLPADIGRDAIREIYEDAYDAGLNGITVYRNGSNTEQPVDLSKE